MTALAVSTAGAILAWIGLALGLVIALVVVALFNRVLAPAREIDRYAGDILEAGNGIARNLEDLGALDRTRDLGAAVPGLATRYLDRLKGASG